MSERRPSEISIKGADQAPEWLIDALDQLEELEIGEEPDAEPSSFSLGFV